MRTYYEDRGEEQKLRGGAESGSGRSVREREKGLVPRL